MIFFEFWGLKTYILGPKSSIECPKSLNFGLKCLILVFKREFEFLKVSNSNYRPKLKKCDSKILGTFLNYIFLNRVYQGLSMYQTKYPWSHYFKHICVTYLTWIYCHVIMLNRKEVMHITIYEYLDLKTHSFVLWRPKILISECFDIWTFFCSDNNWISVSMYECFVIQT